MTDREETTNVRSRKKQIERNTSAPLPGMLQAPSTRKYLSPTLSDSALKSEKEKVGLKKRQTRPGVVNSNRNLPDVSESYEQDDANRPTNSPFGGRLAINEVKDWWRSASAESD